MLSDEAWNRIRAYTDQVCNREVDRVVFKEGAVHRAPAGNVTIYLYANLTSDQDTLEPLPEDTAPEGA